MHDRLHPKWMCSGSRNLIKFGEIGPSGNISETVQDRHIGLVAMDD